MGAISNIYFLLFLPLISSLFCQIFGKKNSSFWIAFCCCFLFFILALKALFAVLKQGSLLNDFNLGPISLALEFKLDLLSALFLSLLSFIKIAILLFYKSDIEKKFAKDGCRNFYSVFLLQLFATAGILLANNLLNLFLFLEIFAFGFFAIFSISSNEKLLRLALRYFCLNSASSLILLFCFLIIFLSFGELNFDAILPNFSALIDRQFYFVLSLFILMVLVFAAKFFPFWLYFEKLASSSQIANFLAAEAIFIKSNIGIFLLLKFFFFFFGSSLILQKFSCREALLILSSLLIFYTALKLYFKKHLKQISLYLCLNNLAFVLACIALQSLEALQALFFFVLNFALVNFLIFIYASFLRRYFASSSLEKISLSGGKNFLLILPLKLLLFFTAAFPLTILFFANWHFAYAAFYLDLRGVLLLSLVFANVAHIAIAIRLIDAFARKKGEANFSEIAPDGGEKFFSLLAFWLLILAIYLFSFSFSAMNSLSLKLASYLIANTI